MKKFHFSLLGLLVATLATAQVHLSLSLLPDGKTYQVGMTPQTTWAAPHNTTGAAQVVVAVPGDRSFLVKNLKSAIQGVTWLDDSYIENPAGAPGWQFVSFSIKEMGTKRIPYHAGEETPLFTFQRVGGDCTDGILLLDNNDPIVQEVVKNKFNITQNFTVLGMRGNAVAGIAARQVDCPEKAVEVTSELIGPIKASPIPASTYLNLEWTNGEGLETLLLQLFSNDGKLIGEHDLDTKPGVQKFQVDVQTMAQGLYSGTFTANGSQKQTFRMVATP